MFKTITRDELIKLINAKAESQFFSEFDLRQAA